MRTLHLLQGGIENGDKRWLERAARMKWKSKSWIAPKRAAPGDYAVIYIGGYGFFATATVSGFAKSRPDWANRYGAPLTSIRLVTPPISLAAISRAIPRLTWANYPRSITTPTPRIAAQIRALLEKRRKLKLPDLDDKALDNANLDELRRVALLGARSVVARTKRETYQRAALALSTYTCCGVPMVPVKAVAHPPLS